MGFNSGFRGLNKENASEISSERNGPTTNLVIVLSKSNAGDDKSGCYVETYLHLLYHCSAEFRNKL